MNSEFWLRIVLAIVSLLLPKLQHTALAVRLVQRSQVDDVNTLS